MTAEALRTELVDIKTLSEDPANVRTHSERNIEVIAASLRRFGQRKPIVVGQDGVVIAGSGTLLAARLLGWSKLNVAPAALDGVERVAYSIADNRTGDPEVGSGWDDKALARELAAIDRELDAGLGAVGFTSAEADALSPNFDPVGIEEQGRLDERAPVTCPECGHEFCPTS